MSLKDHLPKGVFLLSLLFLVGCTQSKDTTRVLQDSGYKNIVITGWKPFSCGDDDTFHTGFQATAPNGKSVTGVVCSGIFKGNTIRLD